MQENFDSMAKAALDWLMNRKIISVTFPIPEKEDNPAIWSIKFTRFLWEMSLARNKELLLGYKHAIENDLIPVAALCSRAALETVAISIYEVIKLEKLASEGNEKLASEGKWTSFIELCRKLHVGYRDSLKEEELRSVHIHTCIKAMDEYFRDFYSIISEPFTLMGLYDVLSNICHPNYHGMGGMYDNKSDGKKLSETFYKSMDIICLFSKMFDEHMDSLEKFVKENLVR